MPRHGTIMKYINVLNSGDSVPRVTDDEVLAAAVKPVRPLWPVSVRLGLWLLLEAIVLVWVATHTGNDFVRKLAHLDYGLEVVFFAAAATLAAIIALRVAIPGRSAGPREVALAVRNVLENARDG